MCSTSKLIGNIKKKTIWVTQVCGSMTGKQLLGTVKEIRKAQEKQRKQQEANDKKAKDIAYAQLNNVMPKTWNSAHHVTI